MCEGQVVHSTLPTSEYVVDGQSWQEPVITSRKLPAEHGTHSPRIISKGLAGGQSLIQNSTISALPETETTVAELVKSTISNAARGKS